MARKLRSAVTSARAADHPTPRSHRSNSAATADRLHRAALRLPRPPGRPTAQTHAHRADKLIPSGGSILPSRFSPAIASMIASKSPFASRLSRVSTLPRNGSIRKSGRWRNNSNCRRADDVPTRAPCPSACHGSSAPALRQSRRASADASRGSSRAGTAAILKLLRQYRRQVFQRMHRDIDPLARSSACSSSRTNSPLPPIRASDAEVILSPRGADRHDLNRDSADQIAQSPA